jgi:metal-responsive CopG/Arc/MetJ family transcriptional regulator
MMNRIKIPSKIAIPLQIEQLAVTSYEDAVQGPDEPRMTKVSVTVDRGLLNFVDHYIRGHAGISRSEIFDKALEIWAKEIQKQADLACYSTLKATSEGHQEALDWDAIQTEAAKHIW